MVFHKMNRAFWKYNISYFKNQNQNTLGGLNFVSFPLECRLLKAGLEHFKSKLIFKQFRLHNNSIFRMHY